MGIEFFAKSEVLSIVNQYARGFVDSTNPAGKVEAGPTFPKVYLEAFDDQKKSRSEVVSSKLRHLKSEKDLSEGASADEIAACDHPHVIEFVKGLREKLAGLSVENAPNVSYRLLLEEGSRLAEKYEFRKQAAAMAEFLPKG